MDFTPTRDTSATPGLEQSQGSFRKVQDWIKRLGISGQAKRISSERQMIAKLDPAELQDRYLRLYDDHLILKQHARKQEDKIKK